MKLKLRPLNNYLIAERDATEDKTPGGIILPDAAKQKSERGKVIAVGPGKLIDDGTREEMPVNVGNTILFTRYGPNLVEIEGKEYLFLRDQDVLAVID